MAIWNNSLMPKSHKTGISYISNLNYTKGPIVLSTHATILHCKCNWHGSPSIRLTNTESYFYLLGEEKVWRGGFRSLKYLKDALQGEVFKIYTHATPHKSQLLSFLAEQLYYPLTGLELHIFSPPIHFHIDQQWSLKNANLILIMACLKCLSFLLTDSPNSLSWPLRSSIMWVLSVDFLIWHHSPPSHSPGSK